jgi:hypothetical protein
MEAVSVGIGNVGTALEMLVNAERLVEETLPWSVWAWVYGEMLLPLVKWDYQRLIEGTLEGGVSPRGKGTVGLLRASVGRGMDLLVSSAKLVSG